MSSTIGALGVHDLGGTGSSEEKIPHFPDDKAFAHWERVTHVLLGILTRKQLLTLDEHRRAVEALPQYNELSYYERWASGTAALCVEKGLFTKAELDAELGEVPTDETIRFKSGDVVRVRDESATVRWRKPHLRAPGYIHGLVGTIEGDCCGLYADPESLAFAEPARRQPLYRVRFHQQDLWEGYQGNDEDTVVAEVYQAWLLPATVADLVTQRRRSARLHKGLVQGTVEHRAHAEGEGEEGGQGPSKRQRKEGSSHSHGHGHGQPKEGEKAHDHDHGGHAEAQGASGKEDHHVHHHEHEHEHEHAHEHEHEHGEEGHAHVHEGSLAVETKAVEVEGDDSARRRFPEAVARLLDKKGIATNEEVRKALEAMDSKGEQRGGARLVARAWTDPEFKARLLADGNAAAAELGLEGSNWPARTDLPADCKPKEKYGTVLTVVENTPEVHNLIVCTLCSCYPIAILGMSPSWYKSRAYRARAIRDPRGVLAEMGLKLPTDVSVKVHDSTADSRYLVLPERPAGTEGWSEEQLATLVTRDAMVGVARASEPPTQP